MALGRAAVERQGGQPRIVDHTIAGAAERARAHVAAFGGEHARAGPGGDAVAQGHAASEQQPRDRRLGDRAALHAHRGPLAAQARAGERAVLQPQRATGRGHGTAGRERAAAHLHRAAAVSRQAAAAEHGVAGAHRDGVEQDRARRRAQDRAATQRRRPVAQREPRERDVAGLRMDLEQPVDPRKALGAPDGREPPSRTVDGAPAPSIVTASVMSKSPASLPLPERLSVNVPFAKCDGVRTGKRVGLLQRRAQCALPELAQTPSPTRASTESLVLVTVNCAANAGFPDATSTIARATSVHL